MRCAVAFDTLEYMNELRGSGMKQEDAEAITKATAKALNQLIETKELATKTDLKELRSDLKTDLIVIINDTMWKTIKIQSAIITAIITIFELLKHIPF